MDEFNCKKPLFILGNPRSGTSLLRLMLHRHSKICIPPESHFFLWLERTYGSLDNFELKKYLKDLYNSTKFETWELNKEELFSFLSSHDIDDYTKLTCLVYQFYAIKHNKENCLFWGDKNSLWIEKLPTIKMHFPEAFYVHIVRDGRDVACSYKSLSRKKILSPYAPKLPNNIEEIAMNWHYSVAEVEAFFLNQVSKANRITVHYEQLLKQPEEVLSQILNKLQLPFEPQQLKYFEKPKHEIEPEEFFAWKEKLLSPPDLNNIGKFEKELTIQEIEAFNIIAFDTLKMFGYL